MSLHTKLVHWKENSTSWLHWALLIFLALIWGSSFILIKKGLLVFSSGEVGALRIVLAGLALFPLSLFELKKAPKRMWALLFFSGMLGSFFPAFLFAKAQTNLESGLTGVLNALTPIFVLIIGASFFQRPITRFNGLGIVVGFAGTIWLLSAGSKGVNSGWNYYALYVILATLMYAINLNIIKSYMGHLKAFTITSLSLVFVSPIALVFLLAKTDFVSKMQQAEGAWFAFFMIALLGVVGTAFALIIFNKLVQMTTPIFTSSVTYLIPMVAVGWGIMDGELLSLKHVLAMVVIVSGVYLANRKAKVSNKVTS